ncbi:MAG: inositol monophosphatase family protein, partial [Phycisphaerales bacterium]
MPTPALPAASLDPRVALLRALGERAGRLTLDHCQHPELAVDHKADLSPVTAADLACEALVRGSILEAFPNDAILGEEHGDQPGTTGFRWII